MIIFADGVLDTGTDDLREQLRAGRVATSIQEGALGVAFQLALW